MGSIRIEILNPKAKTFLKDLVDLKLIRIKKDHIQIEFADLLEKLRSRSGDSLSSKEIAKEVEEVRRVRREK